MNNAITLKNSLAISFGTLLLFCGLITRSQSSYAATPNQSKLFTCIADGTDQCGCLRQNDGSGLIWYRGGLNNNRIGYFFHDGENAIKQFNAENHCGYDDWRMPTFAARDNPTLAAYDYPGHYSDDAQVYADTDLAKLSNYALKNGYQARNDFIAWLNNNGFDLANGGYWAANNYSPSLDNAWVINRHKNNGLIEVMYSKNNNFVIPVRGGI